MPDGVERGEAVAHDPYGVSFPFQIAAYELGLLLVVLGNYDVCAHAPDRRAAGTRREPGEATTQPASRTWYRPGPTAACARRGLRADADLVIKGVQMS
ncbi:hypothetical protein GCM10010342_25120 [Streptomyces anulatus]|nr:hypothetical protein GCM10010342_25120 [Streptomyces anulatus]